MVFDLKVFDIVFFSFFFAFFLTLSSLFLCLKLSLPLFRYKEYRDVTLNGAVEQLYAEMGSRHRARSQVLQIIKTATVPAALCKREATKQFHNSSIKFPLTTRRARPESRVHRTVFKAVRPNVAMQ